MPVQFGLSTMTLHQRHKPTAEAVKQEILEDKWFAPYLEGMTLAIRENPEAKTVTIAIDRQEPDNTAQQGREVSLIAFVEHFLRKGGIHLDRDVLQRTSDVFEDWVTGDRGP